MTYFALKRFGRVHSRYGEIRLSHKWLNEPRFRQLEDREKGVLLCLMLAASMNSNRLPWDEFKLGIMAGTTGVNLHLEKFERLDFIERLGDDQECLPKLKRVHISDDIKAEIITRQVGRCHRCLRPLEGKIEYDHDEPLSKGGSNDTDNLRALHQRCNRIKAAKTRRTL